MSKNQDVGVYVTTYYNDDNGGRIKGSAALKSAKEILDLGYPLKVIDGGSYPGFIDELCEIGAVVQTQTLPGISQCKLELFTMAYQSNCQAIVYMELEKLDLVKSIDACVQPILRDDANIVIPRRKSLDSYPSIQRFYENLGNQIWNQLTGHELDMWFGARIMQRDMCSHFVNYDIKYGKKWESFFVPVMAALFDGYKIQSIDVDYIHPSAQTFFEEGNLEYDIKRLEQFFVIVNALIKYHRERFQ